MRTGPAVAPLRRVVDQIIRLLEVMFPAILVGEAIESAPRQPNSKKNRPQTQLRRDEGEEALSRIYALFVALRSDLERTGMMDVAVTPEEGPGVVLTLDERFISGPCLELLHTSTFSVVGKVTQVWPTADDVTNLYRRSVVALLPSLAQTITWGMLTLVGGIGKSLDPEAMRLIAMKASGVGLSDEEEDSSPDQSDGTATQGASDESGESSEDGEVIFGAELIAALSPAISGPAFQILPLAICS